MAYATLSELTARVGADLYAKLSDRDRGRVADDAVGQAVLDEAQREIDRRLARRYAVPVADATAAAGLKDPALVIATWLLWDTNPLARGMAPREGRQAYEAMLAHLEAIAMRKVDLPGSATENTTTQRIQVGGADAVFHGKDVGGLM